MRPHPLATLPHTEMFTLRSSMAGQDYRLFVALPWHYEEDTRRYPLLVLLDGNQYFGMVTQTVRALRWLMPEIESLIVAAIGYPTDDGNALYRLRARDLTPTRDPAFDAFAATQYGGPCQTGGGPSFLRFLRDEVLPHLEGRYRIEPSRRALAGVSFGGLFTLYTLFHEPALFSRYLVGSPSLFWDEGVAFEWERAHAAAHDDLAAQVFASVGTEEEVPPYHMVSHFFRFMAALKGRSYPSLRLMTTIFPDETHFSVIPATFSRGLRALFAPANDP